MSTLSELDQLISIQNQNPPSLVELPSATEGNSFDVDLNARIIHGPKHLSVAKDHKAEVIYFVVDRYYDYMDLSTTICLVQYVTPDKEPYVYIVPFYDISSRREENKLILPWNIDGAATQLKGPVEYSLRFYKIEGEGKDAKLVYNLNTLSTTSEVLHGLDVYPLNSEKVDFETKAYELIMSEISKLQRKTTYWEILD